MGDLLTMLKKNNHDSWDDPARIVIDEEVALKINGKRMNCGQKLDNILVCSAFFVETWVMVDSKPHILAGNFRTTKLWGNLVWGIMKFTWDLDNGIYKQP